MHRLLAQENSACLLEPAHHRCVAIGLPMLEGCRVRSCCNSSGVVIVLESERNPVQWAAPSACQEFALRSPGFVESAIRSDMQKAMKVAVQGFETFKVMLCQLDRRYRTRGEQSARFSYRKESKFVFHLSPQP